MLYKVRTPAVSFLGLKHNFGEKSATDYSKADKAFEIVHSFFIT
jgi:hypothetical protein